MPKLTIDDRPIEVPPGTTILSAARQAGIPVPALCFLDGMAPRTSCFVCVVKIRGRPGLAPSCATVVEDGMAVESGTEEVARARCATLELLVSDHRGDCVAPCQLACPAGMNIPLMIRHIGAGDLPAAIRTVKQHIALPAVLGRICPAPCEKACRRAPHDEALAICLLKRYAADADLGRTAPFTPDRAPARNKTVAIVGAGPAGRSAAYYLQQGGYDCTVFDDRERPGGMLRYGVSEAALPRAVLDAEIRAIETLGARFCMKTRVGEDVTLDELRRQFDAVFLAPGELTGIHRRQFEQMTAAHGIEADAHSLATATPGVFAGGDAVRRTRLAVRACADGRTAAASVDQYLRGAPVAGLRRPFTTHYGRMTEAELSRFAAGASPERRKAPSGEGGGFAPGEAVDESRRCFHCDCRKPDTCLLRQAAGGCGARVTHYRGHPRIVERLNDHPEIIYEPAKCIACGLCVQIAADAGEPLGLTFIGRGFSVRVGVPFGEALTAGLKKTARACASACPTGAIALKGETPGPAPGEPPARLGAPHV